MLSPRSAQSCCLCPFCCTRAMQTHCLPPHCSTLLHTAPHSTLLHNHRPLSRASGDKSFRRDVFSREARRHRLMCILAATPLLQLFLFCNCSRNICWYKIQLYVRGPGFATHPDSSGFGNSNYGDDAYSETPIAKDLIVAPKPTNLN